MESVQVMGAVGPTSRPVTVGRAGHSESVVPLPGTAGGKDCGSRNGRVSGASWVSGPSKRKHRAATL